MNQNIKTYHRGKIARLPHGVREEVNLRLVNGETSTTILPWLNGLPEVQVVLQALPAVLQPKLSAQVTGWPVLMVQPPEVSQ